jgi:GMP synthase-like glutamine amidotransferase
MKRAVVLQHAEVEGAGRIADLLTEHGYSLSAHTLTRDSGLPKDIADRDLLIVMGGSMGVGDLDNPEFPYLRAEIELLRHRIALDAPVLGVCLGAQLLAHAAGAVVQPMKAQDGSRLYEVGWAPLRFHRMANDSLLDGVPDEAQVVHWHGDHFELPPGARAIASTALCCQGFQLKRRLFGLQFHCELQAQHVEDFLREDRDYVLKANGADGVERIQRDTAHLMGSFQVVGDRLLRNILRAMSEN